MSMLFDTETSSMVREFKELGMDLAETQLKNPWHPVQPITKSVGANRVGLYKIFYQDEVKYIGMSNDEVKYIGMGNDEVKYIGMGNLDARRLRHIIVFNNEGKADVSENGRASDSAVARKMYEHDPKLDNWYFQFLLIDGELVKERMVADYVMKQMETILVRKHKPQFCAEHMVGK